MTRMDGPQARREALLARCLEPLLGGLDAGDASFLLGQVQWVEIAAGEVLMAQGEPGDSAYLTLGGRLRVYVAEDGGERMVRELGRGEFVGEVSLLTGEARSATVVAIRDSLLARIDKAHFDALVQRGPQVATAVARQMVRRLQTQHERRPMPAPVMLALLPVTDGVDIDAFARRLAVELSRHGRACVVDAARVDAELGEAGGATREGAGADARVAAMLGEVEAGHDFVLMPAASADGWARRCARHADELLLLADATRPAALHPVEQAVLAARPARSEAAEVLVLLHPADAVVPRGARRWLARRPVAAHVNIRRDLDRDLARLARLVSRNAIGVVFGGGGARGFAHLGVWLALRGRGVEVDCVGGTSIGAVMAALVALDAPAERAIDVARRAFRRNPTGDYNPLPLLSLIRGRRVRAAIEGAIGELAGGPVDIEDLWKGFFCVASNYTQGREERLRDGDLGRALRASSAIPGALPPVVRDGDLLCDGGTFDNLPVDAMRGMRGVGRVIGIDVGARTPRRLEFDDVPGTLALLRDRLRPRARRRYRLPSLASYLLNVTILYSTSRQRQAQRMSDLHLSPPLHRVGLLEWARFDDILREGERHAAEALDALDEAGRAALGISAGDGRGGVAAADVAGGESSAMRGTALAAR